MSFAKFPNSFRMLALATAMSVVTTAVHAAVPANANDIATLMKALQEQEKRLNDQEKKIKEQEATLRKQQDDFQKLQQQMQGKSAQTPPPLPQQNVNPQPVAEKATRVPEEKKVSPVGGTQAPDAEVVGIDRKPVEPEKPPQIAQTIEEGGVLLSKGTLVVTPSMEYLRSSATRVSIEGFSVIPALNIGIFDVTQIGRNTITAATSLRYGVTNRLEVDTKIPFLYRTDSSKARPVGIGVSQDVVTEADGYGLGDVEFGAHYQINHGTGGWPFLVGNFRVKTTTGSNQFDMPVDSRGQLKELPTGSGFWSFQPSITAIYPSDPAVFFSNWGYLYNMEADFGRFGTIDPGDSISGSFGMSISLNDKSSFSFSYAHSTVFNNEVNGKKLANSTFLQVGTMDLGYSYNLTDRINMNLNVSIGATEDAPDSRVTFRMPIAFDLF